MLILFNFLHLPTKMILILFVVTIVAKQNVAKFVGIRNAIPAMCISIPDLFEDVHVV